MGLFTRLALLPLAPVEGVVWLARQLEEQAAQELYGPESIRRQLVELQDAFDSGQMDEGEFLDYEEVLLDRLDAAQERAETGSRA